MYSHSLIFLCMLFAIALCGCSLPPDNRDGFVFTPGYFNMSDYKLAHKSKKSLLLTRFARYDEAIVDAKDVTDRMGYSPQVGKIAIYCEQTIAAPPRYNLGVSHFKNRNYAEAVTIFADLVCEDEDNFPAKIALALAVIECDYWCKLHIDSKDNDNLNFLLLGETKFNVASMTDLGLLALKKFLAKSEELQLLDVAETLAKILATLYAEFGFTNQSVYYASIALGITDSIDNKLFLAENLMSSGYYSEVIRVFSSQQLISAKLNRYIGLSNLAMGNCEAGLNYLNIAYKMHYPDLELGRLIKYEYSNNYCSISQNEFIEEEKDLELKNWYWRAIDSSIIPSFVIKNIP